MSERVHRFTVGGVEGAVIDILEPDTYDLNQSLPEEHRRPGDATVTYTWHCWYLRREERHIMIDAGYHAHEVVESLARLDVRPEEIELVLITHGDGDHVCGLMDENGNPTFPNARYVLSQALWEFWNDDPAITARYPEERCRIYRGLVGLLRDRCTAHDAGAGLSGGISLIPCPGHREGHITFKVPTAEAPLWFIGDAIFDPVFVEHPDWPDMSDNVPELAAESRRAILEEAAGSGILLFTGHIPFPGIGRIEPAGAGYRWIPTEET